jgi:sugar lactone lactonase YvrE
MHTILKSRSIHLLVFISLITSFLIPSSIRTFAAPTYTYDSQFGTAGSGNGQFDNPTGIRIDNSGNLIVTDQGNNRVQKFDSNGNFLLKIDNGGNNPFNCSNQRTFYQPWGAATDSQGNIYIPDRYCYRVHKFSSSGAYIFTITNTGDQLSGEPYYLRTDSADNLYVVNAYHYPSPANVNKLVSKFDPNGVFLLSIPEGASGILGQSGPNDIIIDAQGNILVSAQNQRNVAKFSSSGSYISSFGTEGTGNGQFKAPMGLAFDSNNNLFVADKNLHRVQIFDSNYNYIGQFGSGGVSGFGSAGNGELNTPRGIAIDSADNAYVADSTNNRIVKFIAPTTLTSVSTSIPNGTYYATQSIPVTVTYNKNVVVTGTPKIALGTTPNHFANYVSGSGTNTLTFNYIVQLGDSAADLDYLSTSSLSLNGGTIKDGGGADAPIILFAPGAVGSLGANKNIVINGIQAPCGLATVAGVSVSAGSANTSSSVCIGGGTLNLYAGDTTPNHDVCSSSDISYTIANPTTPVVQDTVPCTASENSISLSTISTLPVRQNPSSTISDIVFDDLRGQGSSNYTVTAEISNFVDAGNNSNIISLGSNPDNAPETLDPGIISSIKVTNGGSGYTTAPTIAFGGGSGSGATATATVSGGVVTKIDVKSYGTGYNSLTPPTIAIIPTNGGSGATATANIVSIGENLNPATALPEKKVYVTLDPSVGTVSKLKPNTQINPSNFSTGPRSFVVAPATQYTLYNTSTSVSIGRYSLDGALFGLRTPAYTNSGDYRSVITQTIIGE